MAKTHNRDTLRELLIPGGKAFLGDDIEVEGVFHHQTDDLERGLEAFFLFQRKVWSSLPHAALKSQHNWELYLGWDKTTGLLYTRVWCKIPVLPKDDFLAFAEETARMARVVAELEGARYEVL